MLDYHPTRICLQGERTQTFSPDTLDLADRMALAIHALTHVWYPDEKWAQGFLVDFSQRPPVLYPSHITDAYLNIPMLSISIQRELASRFIPSSPKGSWWKKNGLYRGGEKSSGKGNAAAGFARPK
jgi:hypothetical protein